MDELRKRHRRPQICPPVRLTGKAARLVQIRNYSERICLSINSVYHYQGRRFYPARVWRVEGYYMVGLLYGCDPVPELTAIETWSENLATLLENQPAKLQQLVQQRWGWVYPGRNQAYYLQPLDFGYWRRARAIYAAGELFGDLLKSGH